MDDEWWDDKMLVRLADAARAAGVYVAAAPLTVPRGTSTSRVPAVIAAVRGRHWAVYPDANSDSPAWIALPAAQEGRRWRLALDYMGAPELLGRPGSDPDAVVSLLVRLAGRR